MDKTPEQQDNRGEAAEFSESDKGEQAPESSEVFESPQEMVAEADRQVSLLDDGGDAEARKIAENLSVELDEEVKQELSEIAEQAEQAVAELAEDLNEEQKVDVAQLSSDEMIELIGEWDRFTALSEDQKKIMAERLLEENPEAVLSVPELSGTLSAEQKFILAQKIADEDPWMLMGSPELIQSLDLGQRSSLAETLSARVSREELVSSGLIAESSGSAGNPETKEKETGESKTIELRDAEGRLIGRFDVEFGEPDAEMEGHRRLHSLVLHGELDGESTSLDLLQLANTANVSIYVSDERKSEYMNAYRDDSRTIGINSLENQFDLAVLLHELGHAEQYTEEEYSRWDDAYQPGPKGVSIGLSPKHVREDVDEILRVAPEFRESLDMAGIRQEMDLRRELFDEWSAAESQITELKLRLAEPREKKRRAEDMVKMIRQFSSAEEHAGRADEIAEYERQIEAHEQEIREIEEKMEYQRRLQDDAKQRLQDEFPVSLIEQLKQVPVSIMERDATRRALLWIRKIKQQSGVDLLARGTVSQVETTGQNFSADDGSCDNATALGVANPEDGSQAVSPMQLLRAALKTHRADKPALWWRLRRKKNKEK